MSDPRWGVVDAYLAAQLLAPDPALDAALAANAEAGLPAIDVAPVQGKLLRLLARLGGARRILEIGTLGGYSTIWLARALPTDGRLVTLEVDPHRAAVARANLARAGVADRVEVIVGPAIDALPALDGLFDLIFVDADKPSNVAYLRQALRLARPGAAIVVDNVVRAGGVIEAASDDRSIAGTRALFEAVAGEPRLSATAIQTVGAKGWDGFLIAIVD